MAGPLDASLDDGANATAGIAEQPIDRTGFFQNLSAGYSQAQAGPGSTNSRRNAFEARYYDQVIERLTKLGEMGQDMIEVRPGGIGYTGPKNVKINQFGIGEVPVKRAFRNPYTARPDLSQSDNPLARLYLDGDVTEKNAIWAAVARHPDAFKDIPNEAALAALADRDRQRKLGRAEEVTSRANTAGKVGGFIGNVVGSLLAGDPENIAGAGVGGAASSTVARTIIKRAVTEGAANAAAGIIALPGQHQDAERLGIEQTPSDDVKSVGEQFAIGALIGGAHTAAPHVMGAVTDAAGKVADTVAANVPAPVRDTLAAASLRAGTVKDRQLLTEWRRLHQPYAVVGDTATPDEKAAANVVEHDITAREASPLKPDADAAHLDRLGAIAADLGVDLKEAPELPSTAPAQTPTVRDRSGRRPADFVEGINAAEGHTRNPRSSADGYGNFIDSTWLSIAPRVTDTAGMSRDQILALRHDKTIAGKATQIYAQDNARYLRARGLEDSPGNLSLAHFLGPDGAARVLKASPDEPIERILSAQVIHANREVLEGKSASQVIAWAHKRIGAAVNSPVARPDAVPEFDPLDEIDYAEVQPYSMELLKPDEVQTDAALMQYKSGGDENGVTGKLGKVDTWNPMLASQLLIWQRLDGANIVVDGHQRVGLAKRLFPDDPSIRLNAAIVREADGVTARQARVLGALINIEQGFGSLVDNARVLRDAPNGAKMLSGGEGLTREAIGLSRLSYEAFGAVLNDVIDPRIAAQVGLHAGHAPEAHMPLVELLAKEKVTNPAEAAVIARQALADGFGAAQEHQLSLLGNEPVQSLYVPISRILSAAEKRLRAEKRTFNVLKENAGKIEAAGNVLDRAANESKVISNDEALAILERTAHSAGPVRQALIDAARAELSGSGRAHAVNQFLDALAGIDLRAAARGVESDGRLGDSSLAPGERGDDPSADSELPESIRPSPLDEALGVTARAEGFSDPVGAAAKEQTDLLVHDLAMEAAAERTDAPYAPPQMLARIMGGEADTPTITQSVRQVPLFHGTARDFSRISEGSGAHGRVFGKGVYLTAYPDYAEQFARLSGTEGANIRPVFAELSNPYIATEQDIVSGIDIGKKARRLGHDGIVYHRVGTNAPDRPFYEVVAFDPKVVISATTPEPLFDATDQPTFRLDEEGDAKPIHEIMADAEDDEIVAKAVLDCLTALPGETE